MMVRGVTILELLVALGIMAIITASATRALTSGIATSERLETTRIVSTSRVVFEDRVRDLVRHAWLTEDTGDTASFFIGSVTPVQNIATAGTTSATTPSQTGTNTTSVSAGSSSSSNTNNDSTGNAQILTLTTVGQRIPIQLLDSADDWETNNTNLGSQGGVAEESISMVAVGDAGSHTGLYLRVQRPADGDPSQGGSEQVLNPDVTAISFEFFDGTTWQPTWDTRTLTPTKRLPAAVRVTYRFTNDVQNHVFVVAVPASDVTPNNPVPVQGATP